MINEIKTIVQNYLNNAKLCDFMVGTVTNDGVKVGDTKPPIPMELIIGNLKTSIIAGDKIRLLRNHGGQIYYILEVVRE